MLVGAIMAAIIGAALGILFKSWIVFGVVFLLVLIPAAPKLLWMDFIEGQFDYLNDMAEIRHEEAMDRGYEGTSSHYHDNRSINIYKD